MLLQPYKSGFILAMTKLVEVCEARSHWTPMKNSEVKNKHKNKDGKLNTIVSIISFRSKIFLDGRLIKQNTDSVTMG